MLVAEDVHDARKDHAALLHHAARGAVGRKGDGDDLLQAQLLEPELDGCARRLGRVAVAQVRAEEAVADLDLGPVGEVVETRCPDHLVRRAQLDGPEAEPVGCVVGHVFIEVGSRVVRRGARRAPPGLFRVPRDRVPRVEVVERGRPQEQPLGCKWQRQV